MTRQKLRQSQWQKRFYWILANGPAIITVFGSAVLAILSSIISLSTTQILQLVLILLALIGTSLITEKLIDGRELRTRLRDIDLKIDNFIAHTQSLESEGLDSFVIRRRDLPPLEERLDGAKRISISGGSLFRLINEYQNLFEELLESGCFLRFLMTDPSSPAAETLSLAVVYESANVEIYRNQMQMALTSLKALVEQYPDTCQIGLSKLAPPFSLVIVDKANNSSSIQVELYSFRTPARNRPLVQISPDKEPKLYSFFSSQFELIWESDFVESIVSHGKQSSNQ